MSGKSFASMFSIPSLTRQLTSHLDSAEENIDGKISDLAKDGMELEKSESSSSSSVGITSSSSSSTPQTMEEKICAMKGIRVQLRCGIATDIGGGSTNQDDGEIIYISQDVIVFGIFDGHGRELGELASKVAKDSIRTALKSKGMIDRLRADPNGIMIDLFKNAHNDIRNSFREKYLHAKWEVMDTDEGYLIKRQNKKSPWTCTHGGTTATVVVILDGRRMIVANVGDSSAVWGGRDKEGNIIAKELNAEHSPESIDEYNRVRAFRPAPPIEGASAKSNGPIYPEMKFVYDAPSYSKNQCNNIFEHDSEDFNRIRITSAGNYYKNVRNEWATLVTTPPHARFQDALAFTRSLGDLHLHVYGVSEIPAVVEYDLVKLQASVAHGPKKIPLADGIDVGANPSVLFVCSDGVWDNWKFEDIVAHSLKDEIVEPAIKSGSAQKATEEIMKANISLAKAHFGSQADNMTAIVCYITF